MTEQATRQGDRMRKTWLWTALVLGLIAGGSYGLFLYLRPVPLPPQLLYGNGHVEGTEVHVAAEVSGRVVESRLVEGGNVDRGELLVRLDDTDLRLHKARMEAEVEALLRERERAERELEVWRHHLRTAQKELERYRQLLARGTAPPQRLEQAEDAHKEAAGRVAAFEATVAAVTSKISAARRGLDLVANQIEKTRVAAPIVGTVIAKAVEPGEFVRIGQTVAALVDLSRVELKIFVPERDIGKVKLSAPSRVKVDAFAKQVFQARVARVDQRAQFTPRDIHMPDERVRMVFGVTLTLDNPDGVLKPGMPADAWILWQETTGWPTRLFVPE